MQINWDSTGNELSVGSSQSKNEISIIIYQGNLLFYLILLPGMLTYIMLHTPKIHCPLLSIDEAQWSHCSHPVGVKKGAQKSHVTLLQDTVRKWWFCVYCPGLQPPSTGQPRQTPMRKQWRVCSVIWQPRKCSFSHCFLAVVPSALPLHNPSEKWKMKYCYLTSSF